MLFRKIAGVLVLGCFISTSGTTSAFHINEMSHDERLFEIVESIEPNKLGADKNKNGIWDDIDSYISDQKVEKTKKRAMQHYAKAVYSALNSDGDSQTIRALFEDIYRAQVCLRKSGVDVNRVVELISLAVNQPDREVAYSDKHRFGEPYLPASHYNTCNMQ